MAKSFPYPWQKQLWLRLTESASANKLPHALLLFGQEGLGIKEFAIAFAAFLLTNKSINVDENPDYYLIEPHDSDEIKIEQIRNLVNILSKTSHGGGKRVVIINPADAMNNAASNSLLKTLEEPGDDVIFMLLTSNKGKLLATIRSRCQLVHFDVPNLEEVEKWLKPKIADSDPHLLLTLTANSPLAALELADLKEMQFRHNLLTDFAKLMRRDLEPTKFAEIYLESELTKIFYQAQIWLLDLMKVKSGMVKDFVVNFDYWDELNNLCQRFKITKLLNLSNKIKELSGVLDCNLNRQLLLERLAILWYFS